LRIETDDCIVGWGEGKNAAGSSGTYGTLVHILNHEIVPKLIDRADRRDGKDAPRDLGHGVTRTRRRLVAYAVIEHLQYGG
ncbi:mandelate racemase/muconate lactonizing enzyme family protein, partial [Rhizobium ruizarguesonis]